MMQLAKDKRVCFLINPQSIIDVITNSSSELFVFNGNDKEIIEDIIKNVYPDYLLEYEALVSVRELDLEELDSLMNWMTGSYCWPARKYQYKIPGSFTFDELYEAESDKPAHNGELQYVLKKNYQNPDSKWDYSFVTEENYEWVSNKLDPTNSMYLLYSYDENPDWDMQEELMNIGDRYHLG